MKDTPLELARQACDMMMYHYQAADLPPKGHFHYHQGVFLSGVYETFKLCREKKYFYYVKDWVDSCMDDQGNILDFAPGHLDDIQPGILLFPLWKETKAGKYSKAIKDRIEIVDEFPRNPDGGFWHMDIFPQQMWLDGLYMAGPFCAEYAAVFDQPQYFDLAAEQAILMREKTKDSESGLWYHAWDYLKNDEWADPLTGRSPEFWGRSIGWVPVAVLNELDFIPETHPAYRELCLLVKDLLVSVCGYQSEDGRWYQVVNKGGEAGNWLENSCSCLFTAAISKAVRKNILDKEYFRYAQKGYEGVVNSLGWENGRMQIGNVCIGTGVGNYKHYCKRPVSVNDLHGVGAFLVMCTEMERLIGML